MVMGCNRAEMGLGAILMGVDGNGWGGRIGASWAICERNFPAERLDGTRTAALSLGARWLDHIMVRNRSPK